MSEHRKQFGHGRGSLPRPRLATLLVAGILGTVGLMAASGAPAGATGPATLYAAASSQGTGDCLSAANACALPTALGDVVAGGVIALVTAGSESDPSTYYAGNFAVDTGGTSAGAPVTIQPADGVSNPILDGQDSGSVLTIGTDVFVSVSGITVQYGESDSGGGIANNDGGTVNVSAVTFSNNTATSDGGAIVNGDGGSGTVAVTNSTFTGNTAAVSGGAIDSTGTGTLTVTGSTFTGNNAIYNGGAIANGEYGGLATATVTNSTFTGNDAIYNGGAIESGVYGNGTLQATGDAFSGNHADDGGAIDSGDSTGTGTLTVTGSTFTGNQAECSGGAIDQADNEGTGTATIGTSTFSDNSADCYGGAVDSGSSGGSAVVTVTGSTFSDNHGGSGGAIDSGDYGASTLSVTDSTFSGNRAEYDGGAINQADGGGTGTATIVSVTFHDNSTGWGGSTIAAHGTAGVTVAGDVLAGSCRQGRSTWADLGYNVGQDQTCLNGGPGDQVSQMLPEQLGPLADNGGSTETMTLLAGNPGIGAIPNGTSVEVGSTPTTLCPTTDQRGMPSEPGAACNMGALQLAVPSPPTNLVAHADGGQVDLDWDMPMADGGSPITGYQVFRGTTPGGEGSTPIATVVSPSYADVEVTFGTTYYYVVKAVNAVGSSAASNEANAFVSIRTVNWLTSSQNPSPAGPVTFWTGVRSEVLPLTVPTGTVRFVVDGTTYEPCEAVPLGPGGGASCTLTFKADTTHKVYTVYPGSGAYQASTSNKVIQKVTSRPKVAMLASGQSLTPNQSLVAGAYTLVMQGDGNLVEYQGPKALWASGTAGHPGTGVVMQKDGNLVEYFQGHAIWASKTAGHPGAHLTLQGSDGNVVIYTPAGHPVWATGT